MAESMINDYFLGFLFEFDDARQSRFVAVKGNLLILHQEQDTVSWFGGHQSLKDSIDERLPLFGISDDEADAVSGQRFSRGARLLVEGQHGITILEVGSAVPLRRPTGDGEGVLALKGIADFQVGVSAIGDKIGQAARLDLLEVTAARAGIGAARQEQNDEQAAENPNQGDVSFHALTPARQCGGGSECNGLLWRVNLRQSRRQCIRQGVYMLYAGTAFPSVMATFSM